MKGKKKFKPLDTMLVRELMITNQKTLTYEASDDFEDDKSITKLRNRVEKKLDVAARRAITEFWEALSELLHDEGLEIELYSFSDMKGVLRYYMIETPYGDAGVWDVKTKKLVAASTQHSPDNPDSKSLVPQIIQRALVLCEGSDEVCFFALDQDYEAKQKKSFLALKEKFEHHNEAGDWSQQSRQAFQKEFKGLSEKEKNHFLNLITQAIAEDALPIEDHPLFDTGKKFPKNAVKKPSANEKSSDKKSASKRTNDKRPATVEAWRAMFPEKSAQKTIDSILRGIENAFDKKTSANHGQFMQDTKIPLKKQPKDPFEWLLACRSLYLYDIPDFNGIQTEIENEAFTDIRPVSVFTQLTTLSLSASLSADLNALGELTTLKKLYLRGGKPNTWKFFENLSQLEFLTIEPARQETNVCPEMIFKGNTKLKEFVWIGNFSDVSCLSALTGLTRLALEGLNLTDITPLQKLVNLTELDLDMNQIQDIRPLFSLPKLLYLDAEGNRVTSVEGIEKLRKLKSFGIKYNCIADLTPCVKGLKNLRDATRWVEETTATQLPIDSPTGQALYNDWRNISKWKAHAKYLKSKDHPLGEEIASKLTHDFNDLPWTWVGGKRESDDDEG